MTSLVDIGTSHWADIISENMQSMEVAEWIDPGTGKPITIYWKPANMEQRDRINDAYKSGVFDAVAETLICRALDKDGKPYYKRGDKADLMRRTVPAVMEKIAIEMNKDLELTVEEAGKNSCPIQE